MRNHIQIILIRFDKISDENSEKNSDTKNNKHFLFFFDIVKTIRIFLK